MLREGGQRMVLCPYTPDTNLFGYGEGIVDFAVLSIFLRLNNSCTARRLPVRR